MEGSMVVVKVIVGLLVIALEVAVVGGLFVLMHLVSNWVWF